MTFQDSFKSLVVIYIFLTGLGAGCILSAAIADFYDRTKYISYIKAGSILGTPLVLLGCSALLLNLGQGLIQPWRLFYLFLNPTSFITWGTAILIAFLILSSIYAAYNFNLIKSGGGKWLKFALIFVAVGTSSYTGVLLGVLKSIPFWNQTTLPVLFLISALSGGIAISLIVENIFCGNKDVKILETGHTYLLIAELVIIAGILLIASHGVPEMVYSVKSLVDGQYSLKFWVIFIFFGEIIPIIFHIMQEAGLLKLNKYSHIAIELLVLSSGFTLIYLIIHAGIYTIKFTDYINIY